MAMDRNNRETEGTGSGSDWVGQKKKGQEHVPGDDPVAATDPNAEGASLAADGSGLGQVDELRREADSETSDRNRANDEDDDETDNGGQKTVQGKNQKGPEDKVGRSAGGNEGSKGQNSRGQGGTRAGDSNEERSHAGKAGPNRGSSSSKQATRQNRDSGENQNAKRFNRPGSQPEQGNKGKAK